jgi:hypothetical protein
MPRRYLTEAEAMSALRRGKAVEAFLGACSRDGAPGVRWLQVCERSTGLDLRVYESADVGSEDFLDLYEFGPLDPALDQDEANEVHSFLTFGECVRMVEDRWPGAALKLVNEGIVQDEYAEYLRTREA